MVNGTGSKGPLAAGFGFDYGIEIATERSLWPGGPLQAEKPEV